LAKKAKIGQKGQKFQKKAPQKSFFLENLSFFGNFWKFCGIFLFLGTSLLFVISEAT
jgi:hypothetical protein